MDIKEESIDTKSETIEKSYATGRRKNSIARVWVKKGSGSFKVNGKELSTYVLRPVLRMVVNQPINVLQAEGVYDIMATVKGGGLSGQAGAIRHGISKALSLLDQLNRPPLKKVGLLTRDPRVVERKKAGLAKARRSYQFSKR